MPIIFMENTILTSIFYVVWHIVRLQGPEYVLILKLSIDFLQWYIKGIVETLFFWLEPFRRIALIIIPLILLCISNGGFPSLNLILNVYPKTGSSFPT